MAAPALLLQNTDSWKILEKKIPIKKYMFTAEKCKIFPHITKIKKCKITALHFMQIIVTCQKAKV